MKPMTHPTHLVAALATLALAAGMATPAAAQRGRTTRTTRSFGRAGSPSVVTPTMPSDPEFKDYEIILTRDMFDPNRVPPPPPRPDGATPRPTPEPNYEAPVERIDLLGTWIFDNRRVAFINGNARSARGGQVALGGEMGGWKVAAISTDGVTLTSGTEQLEVPVGQGLQRQGEEPWHLVASAAIPDSGFVRRPSTSSTSRNNTNTSRNNGFDRNGGGFGGRGGFGNNGGGFANNGGGFGGRGGFGNNGGFGNSGGFGNNDAAPTAAPTPMPEPSDDLIRRMEERRRRQLGGGSSDASSSDASGAAQQPAADQAAPADPGASSDAVDMGMEFDGMPGDGPPDMPPDA